MRKHFVLTIFLVSLGTLLPAQDFKTTVDSVYNFEPRKLKAEEMRRRSGELDSVWTLVKNDTTRYLPLLRKELRSPRHYPFFYYDGSSLLLSLSETRSDKQLAANSIASCNIKDLSPRAYVSMLNTLASDNINVTRAAFKILEDSTFSFFLPQHAMRFSQDYCFMYSLLPMQPGMYIDSVLNAFERYKDISTRKVLVSALWFSNSCKGDKFLNSLKKNKKIQREVADYALRLDAVASTMAESYPDIKKEEELAEMKRSALSRFSDEALEELRFACRTWRSKFKCR